MRCGLTKSSKQISANFCATSERTWRWNANGHDKGDSHDKGAGPFLAEIASGFVPPTIFGIERRATRVVTTHVRPFAVSTKLRLPRAAVSFSTQTAGTIMGRTSLKCGRVSPKPARRPKPDRRTSTNAA